MARIVDKDTRLIDVDFGPVFIQGIRTENEPFPSGGVGGSFNNSGAGVDQLIRFDDTGIQAGSFIQYQIPDYYNPLIFLRLHL